ncbi:alginate lyase [Novosphingobium barchaimii LL02]|uniref:Alginate lyase n=1 Tax=Novosphingobium barchaimii LL02 TaxID=1114963 RepID=A0A0J7XXJ2_9SPHN|nr:alginate lyase family protein [Novosphingobium barchaimii]KMS56244.1 alginate lyase [Novosphingobium barchaimii LL02]
MIARSFLIGVAAIAMSPLTLPMAAQAAADDAHPVLMNAGKLSALGANAQAYPLFGEELARVRKSVDAAMKAGISVPVPKDAGGGASHEQHKRNYTALYGAGQLYRITGERRYADFARDMLLAYAKLYPTLGPHPAASNQAAGRLFWQSLNDSVWLVYAVQGYDAVRDALTPQERQTIDDNVFRKTAQFLSTGSPKVFDRIHNHATWANAGVGMTGYVLRDPDLVEKALKGLDKSGKSGFLRQLDLLFSPDGYYAEGPYYQRYALQPFVIFAAAIEANEPQRRIFAYRDGIVPKAIRTTIQLTYDGYFFPLNDAMPDKSLRTEELYQAVAIGYGVTHDPALLSIAQWQKRTVLTPQGLEVARDVAAGKARPFPFASMLLRDGPDGDKGGLAILRAGPGDKDQVLVAKNTAQGMGHGHFDKLNWLLYDNGQAIVTDYGAARFLNIEAKDGGRYLPENESWAKQTVAHNTLVVNETSHFGGDAKLAETLAPRQLHFSGEGPTRASIAEMDGAYPGVTFRRALVQLDIKGLKSPLMVDLLKVKGGKPARYDLPLHFAGHIIDTGFPLQSNVTTRPLLGKADGYQHLWVDATGKPGADNGVLTWIQDGRFYSYRIATPGVTMILGESGASDPRFNLRREPFVIQRLDGATDAAFVSLLEPHGRYDASAETTTGSESAVRGFTHARQGDLDVVTLTLRDGRRVMLVLADDTDPARSHSLQVGGKAQSWKGPVGRFDGEKAK